MYGDGKQTNPGACHGEARLPASCCELLLPSFVWRASMHMAGRKQRSVFLWTAAESKRIPSRFSCRSLHAQFVQTLIMKHETVNLIGASLSEPHRTSCWPSSLAAILDRRRRRTFNFWSALISVDQRALSFRALHCYATAWPAAHVLCLHVTLLVLPACACTLACLVPRVWEACMGRPRC